MAFALHPEEGMEPPPPGNGQLRRDLAPPPENVVLIKARPGPLVAPVLGRVVSLLAARADFSIDKLSDTQLVSDAIAQHSSHYAIDGHVTLTLDEIESGLELRVGPLVPGGSERLVGDTDLPGMGRLLETLSESVDTELVPGAEDTSAEMLLVQLGQPDLT
jgi:serine/threonine-protein kinase RsbW